MSIEGSNPYRVHDDSQLRGGRRAATRRSDPSFDVQENRGVHVVTLRRREYLDGGEIAQLGADLTAFFADRPEARVVLDLREVRQLSSAALGVILNLRGAIERGGGAIVLAGVRPEIVEVFEMTNLHKVLTIRAHVADAIAQL